MQVQNVGLSQNNYSQKHNPNFTAIKSVKCDGLYKKYPELANELVTAFKKNPTAMEFCKKYDVDVVFYAVKQMQDAVESSIHIFFDNISKSKARKFFDKVLGKNEDKVVIHAWGNEYSLPRSLEKSTANLVVNISPERKVGDRFCGGLLDSHINAVDKEMQRVLKIKAQKTQEKEAPLVNKKETEKDLQNATFKLKDSIEKKKKKGS